MSFQTFVTERLEDLTAKYNALVINAKRIFELPRQLTLNPTSLIHVSRDGVSGPVSESLEVQKIIDAIVDKMFSHLLEVGDITVAGLVVTVPANAKWVYEGIHYGTIADTNITETLCAADHLRKDILVANQSNQIVLIKGDESETIRIRPNVPIGSILVTEIDVDDTTIGTPTPPVTLQDLAYKLDKGAYTGDAGLLDNRITTLESAISSNEYANLFTYASGDQKFTVPDGLKIMSVTLGEGRVLFKTTHWQRNSPTEIEIILLTLEAGDTIYITGSN